MGCGKSTISTADSIVLGVVQIMIGIFHVLMWYFLLVLYMGQIKGVFGTYEPLTYKTGCSLWGLTFIVSGAFTVRSAQRRSRYLIICALSTNILSIIVTVIAAGLTVAELNSFHSLSYRNFGQAKLGREVSRILLVTYPLEFAIALTYAIYSCSYLSERLHEESLETVTDVVESSF